jgi:hypothetical protein
MAHTDRVCATRKCEAGCCRDKRDGMRKGQVLCADRDEVCLMPVIRQQTC